VCKFRPFNKHILVKPMPAVEPPETTSGVLLPDNFKPQDDSRYGLVKFICASTDCENFLQNLNGKDTWATRTGTMDDVFVDSAHNNGTCSLVVDKSMIEEVIISDKKFEIIHQNYVVGVVDE
jgi:hypothetical protein